MLCVIVIALSDCSDSVTLLQKIKAAATDMHDHVINHEEYQLTLCMTDVAQWSTEVEAWEKDSLAPNPLR